MSLRHPSPSATRGAGAAAELLTKAWEERTKAESERHSAAQKAKQERMAREALLQQRQQERSKDAHRAASTLRAKQTAAVMAKKAELHGERRSTTDDLKHHREMLRKQRDEQRSLWRAHGRQLNDICVQTRTAAHTAREQVRQRNLSEAHRSTADLLDKFRQGAESQTAFNDSKRLLAESVRREAGLQVVRSARTRACTERARSASNLRAQSERAELQAERDRLAALEAHRSLAHRVELAASPERVRVLKGVEADRKASLTGGLRRQYRALEALALERRSEEAGDRQRMHDNVMCARYGVPAKANLSSSGVFA